MKLYAIKNKETEMKMFAIREKSTGKFAVNWWVDQTSFDEGLFFSSKYLRFAKRGIDSDYEIVPLQVKILSTKPPCDWCSGDWFWVADDLKVKFYEHDKTMFFAKTLVGGGYVGTKHFKIPVVLCPNCGRSLK